MHICCHTNSTTTTTTAAAAAAAATATTSTSNTDRVEKCVQCGISRSFILKRYTTENGNPTGTLCRCCRKAKQLKYKGERAAKEAAETRERATDVD